MDFNSNNILIDKPPNTLSRNALAMISEGITLPIKRVPKQTAALDSSKGPAEPIAPRKNFLKLNMEVLKDGLPSIPSQKRVRAASVKALKPP